MPPYFGMNQTKNRSQITLFKASFLVACWSLATKYPVIEAFFSNHQPRVPRTNRLDHDRHVTPVSSNIQTTKTQLNAASRERSCIELIDPLTGCEVVLMGCFHGSPSSAQDVAREILAAPTDVIALELCASRFADLRRSMAASKEKINPQKLAKTNPNRLARFVQVVFETAKRKGLSTGVATGILGGVSGLQTALSGFTPGLEFTTALELATSKNNGNNNNHQKCDIILADQVVDETIEKVGQLPMVIQSMTQEILLAATTSSSETDTNSTTTQWHQMAQALSTALVGDASLRKQGYQVNVAEIMTRNAQVLQELARLMIPPIVITQLTLTTINQLLFPSPQEPLPRWNDLESISQWILNSLGLWNPSTTDLPQYVGEAVPHVALLGFLLAVAYAFLAVPVTQVILAERDEQLTDGIQAACRLAAEKSNNGKDNDKGKGRVVAVLGLLHVNGVAKRMLAAVAAAENSEEDTTINSRKIEL